MRRRLLIWLVLVPLLMGVLVLWLASSETALQWAARKVTETSSGTVTVTDVSGSLARTLRIGSIRYRSPERNITIEDAELTWSPASLLYDRIAIGTLAASTVTIESLKSSGKPPTLPQKLALPLELVIGEARVGTVAFVKTGVRVELHNLNFRLAGDALQWQLTNFGLDTPAGRVGGEATLGAARPFPVEGGLQLASADANGTVHINGNLSELLLDANFAGYGATGTARAVATPFEAFALRSLALNASGIDPSKAKPGWPKADLSVALNTGFRPDGKLQGVLTLDNPGAGPLDRQRLPLLSAKAQLDGTVEAARLSGVLLDFGSAGQFAGSGTIAGSEGVLTLHTARFDLKEISGSMKRTRIAGDISLTGNGNAQTLEARLGQEKLRLYLNVVKEDSVMRLIDASLSADGGKASATGQINLADSRPFALEGAMRRFNPAAFGSYPAADLNLDFALQGNLAPQWLVAAHYKIQPSRLFNQSLSGQGSFTADAKHVRGVDANLALGPNTAVAHGNFGLPGDRMQWRIDAPRLAVLGPQYGGALKGEGELGGSLEAPHLSLLLDGSGLVLEGYSVRALHASANFGEGEQGPMQADIRIDDARGNGFQLKSLRAQIDGTRPMHTLTLSAGNDEFDLTAQAVGGWHAGRGWEGTIRSLQNRGSHAFSLQNPAPLRVGAGKLSLQNLMLNLVGGSINIASLEKNGPQLSTIGSATGVPLSWLTGSSASLGDTIDTNLILGANWALTVGDTVDGEVHLFREAGDITLRVNATTLGLTALDLEARIVKNAVQARVKISGEKTGNIQLAANTQLAKRSGAWGLPMQSPLRLSANADIPSLAWLGPMSGNPGIEVGGRLALALTGSGAVGKPQLSGEVSGDGLALRLAEQGVNLHGGVLRAQFRNDTLQLQQASINGDEGTLRVEGGAHMAESQLVVNMKLVADKLLLLSRPDRILAISGESALSLDQRRLQLTGKLQADRARIEFKDQKNVTFSDDVVVLGQERKKDKTQKPLPIRYDMELDLGRQFYVKGKGLDARMAGSVRVYSEQDRLPRARGTVQVEEGTYEAYGRKLQIERGLIVFNGPINNPALDILAVRKVPNVENAVEAGVSVRGTALAPNARLVSTPAVSDTEKLSWLVLGKGTDQAGRQEFDVLAAAASALFSTRQAESLQSRLADTFGVDEFGLSSSGTSSTATPSAGTSSTGASSARGLESTVVTVGKRISSRVYLTFEQGVSGATSLVKLRYMLSRRLSVELGTGTSSSVDLVYNWRFD
jgi:translocation and assembly module TamB